MRRLVAFMPALSVLLSQLDVHAQSPVGQARTAVRPAPDTTATPYMFYQPEIDYGSHAIRTPFETFVNRGMSVVAFDHTERRLGEMQWRAGFSSVSDALLHPRAAIERYGGVEKWLRMEFIISNGKPWHWAFAPNIGGHIIAGGITHRHMTEWYHAHGVPGAAMAAAATGMAMMVVNETLEHPEGGPGNASTVADLYIFDPLGMIVFSSDRVAGFFAHTLQAADWSPQASLTLPDGRVMNASQLMSYKIPLPSVGGLPVLDRMKVLLVIGQGAGGGVQYAIDDEYNVAGTIGFLTKKRHVDPETGAESIEADYGWGVFVDRNNSLLGSAVLSKEMNSRLQLNLYPGVLPGVLRPLGVWTTISRRGWLSMGVAMRRTLGVGAGWDFGR